MVFRGADHDEQLGALQIGAAEFPERTTHGVDHAGGHIDRAKAAMCSVVGGTELFGEQAGHGLHLVAACK